MRDSPGCGPALMGCDARAGVGHRLTAPCVSAGWFTRVLVQRGVRGSCAVRVAGALARGPGQPDWVRQFGGCLVGCVWLLVSGLGSSRGLLLVCICIAGFLRVLVRRILCVPLCC